MYATGTYYDAGSAEYALMSVNINGYGTSYEVELAWTMTPALIIEVEPVVVVRNSRYLIWYQLASSKDIYLFETARDNTNLSLVNVSKFTLPVAYQSSYAVSYSLEYALFIGIATDTFWFASYKVRSDSFACQKEQTGSVSPMTTCGSCAVRGDQNSRAIIAGAFDGKL